MLQSDLIISKLKLKSKLRDRKRTKGFSFSIIKKENIFDSPIIKQFRKERAERKALNNKEIKILRNNLIKIRKEKFDLEKTNDNEKEEEKIFTQINPYNNKKVFFHKIDLKKFKRQKNQKDEDLNIKNNKEKIKEKLDHYEINKIISEIKNNSYNFYKILNNVNLEEKIFKNNDHNNIKFYKNFLGLIKYKNKSTSAKNIKTKYISKLNFLQNHIKLDSFSSDESKNFNSICSSFIGKEMYSKNYLVKQKSDINLNLSDKNDFVINDSNTYLNSFRNMKSDNSNDKLSYKFYKNIFNHSFIPSTNITNRTKSKLIIKKNHVINKPMYKTNIQYFIKKFNSIKKMIKNDEVKRKEGHLITYNQIENFSKIREDMLTFRLRLKYIHTQFPKNKNNISDKTKLLFNKLNQNFDKQEKNNSGLQYPIFFDE